MQTSYTSDPLHEQVRPDVPVQCHADDGFMHWLSMSRGSLAVSTYQAGKLLMIGWSGDRLNLLMRSYDKPMGMDISGRKLVLATRNNITVHANDPVLAMNYRQPGQYDALYLPKVSWHTGDLNVHDVAFAGEDIWLVNTRFSCLSLLSEEYTFIPKWRPAFVSDTVPEDRCHLNGLAIVEGRPHYVTCLGETDAPGGWRDNKASGGVIIDIDSDEIILRGLAMPHSPRYFSGQLYVLNSGAGQLLRVNVDDGSHDVVCELQGYLRGLSFIDHFAIVGLCKIRESNIFGGMPVQDRFDELICGVAVVDLKTGQQVGIFEFTSGCEEIFDIRFLQGTMRPNIFNTEKPETLQAFNAPEFSYWLRPSNMIEESS